MCPSINVLFKDPLVSDGVSLLSEGSLFATLLLYPLINPPSKSRRISAQLFFSTTFQYIMNPIKINKNINRPPNNIVENVFVLLERPKSILFNYILQMINVLTNL